MENTRGELFTEELEQKKIEGRNAEERGNNPALPAGTGPDGRRRAEDPENILALPPGTVLDGRYRIVRVIRQGGFGITYEAVHLQSGRKVALKEYFCREVCVRRWQIAGKAGPEMAESAVKAGKTSDSGTEIKVDSGAENGVGSRAESRAEDFGMKRKNAADEMSADQAGKAFSVTVASSADRPRFEADRAHFLREARILREFAQEPAVVTVLDYFEENGTAYIVMEFLEARTLGEEIREGGTWSMEETVRRFGPVMEVLARIHAAGMLHRDISPGNLMVLPDGTLKLIDFGAARELESADRTHSAIYTRGYSAPEQRDQKGKLGSWTDVYGLCCVFWFCLTGRDPEDAQSRLLYDELEKPSSLGGKISPAAEELLMRGQELDSSVRIRDVETLRLALEKLYPSLTEEQRKEREARKKRRLRAAGIAGGFVLLAAACLAVIFRTKILFFFIDTQVVALDGSQMTPEEYADSAPKVRERVEALAGKGRYLWKEEGDQQIFFEIPEDSFGDADPEEFVKMMLTRPMVMRIYAEVTQDPEGTAASAGWTDAQEDSAQTEGETSDRSGLHDPSDSADPPASPGRADAREKDTSDITEMAARAAAAGSLLSSGEEKRNDGKKTGDLVSFSFDPEGSYRYLGVFQQEKTVLDLREVSEGKVLVFRDEAASCLDSLLSAKGMHFLFCFDEFTPDGEWRNSFSFSSGYTMGDGKSIFFSKEDHPGDFFMPAPLALLKLIYGEAPSAAAFYIQFRQEADWEDPEDALIPGKNQTMAERIHPPCIQLQYVSRYSLTAGEQDGYTSSILSIHAVVKNRLDSLGIPYAIGSDPADSAKLFVLLPLETGLCREELEKLGEDIAGSVYLGSLRASHRNGFAGSSFYVQETGENSWEILMEPDGSDQSAAEEILQTLLKQGEEEVFLYVGYRPVAAGDLREAVRSLEENGTIAFSRWTFSEYRAMDAATLPLGRFIVTCFEQDPEKEFELVSTQVRKADGSSRYFLKGLPDRIDIDPGVKWAKEQDPGNNTVLAYRSSLRSLVVTMYDRPLEQPEKCLAEGQKLLERAREEGAVLNEFNIACFEKPKGDPTLLHSGEVYLNFEEDFEAGSMCLDYGAISGFSKEDAKESERAEELRRIYFRAIGESDFWNRMLGEQALQKQEEIFSISDL